MNEPISETPKSSAGYGTGVVLGTILGGVSLFFFGTKTGQKITSQLRSELNSGELNFKELQERTDKKLKDFFSSTQIVDYLKNAFPSSHVKSAGTKQSPKGSKKNFFFKKGKKLG